jgi:hypothetical protein
LLLGSDCLAADIGYVIREKRPHRSSALPQQIAI